MEGLQDIELSKRCKMGRGGVLMLSLAEQSRREERRPTQSQRIYAFTRFNFYFCSRSNVGNSDRRRSPRSCIATFHININNRTWASSWNDPYWLEPLSHHFL